MKKKSKEIVVFGLSFMDVISCGLGGMLVLMFVFSTMVKPEGVEIQQESEQFAGLASKLSELDKLTRSFFILNVHIEGSNSNLTFYSSTDSLLALASYFDDSNISRHIAVMNKYSSSSNTFKFELHIKDKVSEGSFVKLISDKEEHRMIPVNTNRALIRVEKEGSTYTLDVKYI